MAAKASREQSQSPSEWDEIQGLRRTILEEFYERDNAQGCLDDCRRLESLLRKVARAATTSSAKNAGPSSPK